MIKPSDNQKREAAVVDIVYYTDPLCSWSWAFEPQWRRLRYEYGDQLRWRYCMGGLLPNWEAFNDPFHAVSRPVQMGPLWYETKYISGMPIRERIWMDDPPASSYPGCMAVKCAALQSPQAEEALLRSLREAVMMEEKNIARQEVILQVAREVESRLPTAFSYERFEQDLLRGAGYEPFRKDLQQVAYQKISRFPTLTLTRSGGTGVIIVGYRPYVVLLEALSVVAPGLKPVQNALGIEEYQRCWGSATERELKELTTPDL